MAFEIKTRSHNRASSHIYSLENGQQSSNRNFHRRTSKWHCTWVGNFAGRGYTARISGGRNIYIGGDVETWFTGHRIRVYCGTVWREKNLKGRCIVDICGDGANCLMPVGD
jgi:hypothetical protein